jgi:hypothetical protein
MTMALIQLGSTVTGIRGTINGITFSANASGTYAKGWSRPPLSRSEPLSLSRSRLTTAAGQYQLLSGAEKTNWDNFASSPNEPDYDPWGAQRWITGFQWFTRATARRNLIGLDYDVAVPTGAGLAAPAGFALSIETPATGASAVSWTSGEFAAGEAAILYLAPTPSIAATDVWRGWRLVLAMQDPGDTGEDITTPVLDIFGEIPASWWFHGRLFKQAELGNRGAASVTSCEIVEP